MVKTAQLDLIKQAAFQDELEKLAGPIGLVAKFLLKKLPKLIRGTAGKIGGREGVRWLHKSEGIIGNTYRGLNSMASGATNYTGRQILSKGISSAASKWGTSGGLDFAQKGGLKSMESAATKATGGTSVQSTNMFGAARNKVNKFFGGEGNTGKMRNSLGVDNPVSAMGKNYGGIPGAIKRFPRQAVGEIASNLQQIGQSPLNWAKSTIQKGRTFSKQVDVNGVKQMHRFKRNPIGQVGGVAMSPAGWGAQELMSSTDDKGNKRGMTSRVGNAAAWAIAPRIATAKMIAGAVL